VKVSAALSKTTEIPRRTLARGSSALQCEILFERCSIRAVRGSFGMAGKSVAAARAAGIVRALPIPKKPLFMSQHRSLKGQSTIAAKRNVLKRFERVELLTKRGQFKPGDRVIGLRKTKPDA